MKTITGQHPSAKQLKAFGLGLLAPWEHARLEQHVAACDSCCAALQAVPVDTLVGHVRDADSTPGPSLDVAPAVDLEVPPELAAHPRYRIVQLLGAGGMGVVYQAVHRLMDRPVALKVISSDLISNPHAVERFRLEVKAAARLSHPNIVTAFDADRAGDLHFLVMELVDGVCLEPLIREHGPLAPAAACHYARQAALGLQHAFEQGMVHRDIKPHNLMLTRQGQIKVLDFGLARFARDRLRVDRPDSAVGQVEGALTGVGMVLGTPDYIAPEQARDSRLADCRSDIYSLGCTLYFLLSGRVPFPDETALAKVVSHLESVADPLADLRNAVPKELADVVARMMAKDPAQRYQTPLAVAEALAPFARPASSTSLEPSTGREPGATPVLTATAAPATRHLRALVVAAGLVLLGVGVPLGWLLFQQSFARQEKLPTQGQRSAVGESTGPKAAVAAKTPRVLMVLPHQGLWYPDYGPVRKILDQAGILVDVASSTNGPVIPAWRQGQELDPPVHTTLLVDAARAADYDAVVFVGADRPTEYLKNKPKAAVVRQFLADMLQSGKYVTALCRGVEVLADAGVLKDQRAAYNPWLFKDAANREADARWTDKENVIVSGRIITGKDWHVAEEFAHQLVQLLRAAP